MKKLSRKLGILALGAMMSGTALLATPKAAEAQGSGWWIYAGGGYGILTGTSSDFFKSGFTGGVAFGKVLQDRFALGLFGNVGFHSAKSISVLPSGDKLGKATVWRYGLWGGVNALEPVNPWDVWFGLGVGLGTVSEGESIILGNPVAGFSSTRFLLQGNIAVSRQVSQTVALGVNGTFYIIFLEGDSWTAIPLEAFVSFTP